MADTIQDQVRSKYGAVAQSGLSSGHDGVRAVAEAFGYTPEELASIPAEANMGLSCGNPTATANLKPGEVVVDLGCGGGLDVFLAAAKVGPEGRAIGIDMTEDMIALAQKNAASGVDGKPVENVEFHLATIDNLPLEDNSVDCIISNCVINLAPDKLAVFREIARVLKPGGRLAVSDIALKKELPEELASDVAAYVGCIAGAISIDEYRNWLTEAGFSGVEVVDTGSDLNAYAKVENQSGCCSPTMASAELAVLESGCCSPAEATAGDACCEPASAAAPASGEACCEPAPADADTDCCSPVEGEADPGLHERLADLLQKYDVNDYAASVRVFAINS
ncbi:Demethylmenaquinone methyltransferase [Maioricimonas rarisocia]|uniref:Arsenite methyltransferase n=1 Tax=Maioricimonas rarisocia TaxID=2528026 RepID=A0A517Z6C4_9PLAN|nr:arsenite methyltransferase [Maioricimonas rarisocia]QDU38027.1 Demethylmenaquinone methyltransferase [Maioricimonas rarisocia]